MDGKQKLQLQPFRLEQHAIMMNAIAKQFLVSLLVKAIDGVVSWPFHQP